jgi:hypothetical protein
MSIEAELVNSLRKLQTQVASTEASVGKLGDRMTQSMRRGGEQVERVGASVEKMNQRVSRAGMSILSAFGIGTAGAAIMTGINLVERAIRASQEARAQADRDLRQSRGISADTPGARQALARGMPTASPEQRTAFARSFAGGLGAQPQPAQLEAAGRVARATGFIGADQGQIAEALGAAAAAGVPPEQFANVAGSLLSSNQLGRAGTMSRGQLRRAARTGDLGAFIGSQTFGPEDIAQGAGVESVDYLNWMIGQRRDRLLGLGPTSMPLLSHRSESRVNEATAAATQQIREEAISSIVGPEFAPFVRVVGWEGQPPIAQPVAPETP